jgi:hypothetical protein
MSRIEGSLRKLSLNRFKKVPERAGKIGLVKPFRLCLRRDPG